MLRSQGQKPGYSEEESVKGVNERIGEVEVCKRDGSEGVPLMEFRENID